LHLRVIGSHDDYVFFGILQLPFERPFTPRSMDEILNQLDNSVGFFSRLGRVARVIDRYWVKAFIDTF
jgi:hypothetical protein